MLIEMLKVILLGIVEGITEWLPISSTGHMILVDEFIKLNVPKDFMEMFLVVIQLGAILAVCVIYFHKLNPFSPKKSAKEKRETVDIWGKVIVGCLPAAVIGLAFNDKIDALDAGADDYLTKPFHLDELSARIRSLTLRKFTQHDIVLKCSNLSFNTKTRKANVKDEELSLTRKETGILEYLMLNQGRPVSQEELIEHVWDSSVDNFSNSIRVHISSLRKKLRNALGYDPIHNRISEGYVMEEKK